MKKLLALISLPFIILQASCAAQTSGSVKNDGQKNTQKTIESSVQALHSLANGEVRLVKRIVHYGNSHSDIVDTGINSPKSAIFTPDGKKLYINSLEGMETLVYSFPDLKKLKTISHRFNASNANLFQGLTTAFDYPYFIRTNSDNKNVFGGKPVELALSHNGRYLWVTYYRRDYDANASSPSAVAVIDTHTDIIVRVIPTGPLPKMITISPDNKMAAIVHWGDNTIGILDISSGNPEKFAYIQHLVVGKRLNVQGIQGNRDQICGFCLRGARFTQDSKYLFVGRMGGGGIALFDMIQGQYMGTFTNVAPTPRHLVMSKNGKELYVSSNRSGIVTKFDVDLLLSQAKANTGSMINNPAGKSLYVGPGVRTISLSPDNRYLYVVSNLDLKLIKIDVASWKNIGTAPAAAYPVGLAVSPDGTYLVTTSQGREGKGGNAVGVYATNPK